MTESAVLTAVLKHLGNRDDCRVARMNVGNSRGIIAAFVDRVCRRSPSVANILRAALASDRAATRFGVPGMADVMGIRSVRFIGEPTQSLSCIVEQPNGGRDNVFRVGQVLAIETKSNRGTQSIEQRAFQRTIESFGGLYILENDPALPNVKRYFP